MVRGLLKISAINWKILFLNNRKSRAVHGAGDYPLSVVRAFVSNYPPFVCQKILNTPPPPPPSLKMPQNLPPPL